MEPTKILIVDDSAVVRKSLIKLLEEMGAQVTAAEDGEQGLEAADFMPPFSSQTCLQNLICAASFDNGGPGVAIPYDSQIVAAREQLG